MAECGIHTMGEERGPLRQIVDRWERQWLQGDFPDGDLWQWGNAKMLADRLDQEIASKTET